MLHNLVSFDKVSVRYGSVGVIVALAVLTRWLLEPVLENAGFSIFLVAVLMGAWVGGIGPSLLGQTLLLLIHAACFAPSQSQHPQTMTRTILGFCAYYLVGTVVAALSEARQAALKRVAQQIEKVALQDEKLQATISGIGDGVLVTDHAGRVSFMNPVAQTMTGWLEREALGQAVESVFQIQQAPGGPIVDSPLGNVLQTGESLRESRVLYLVSRHGQQVPVTFNATPIRIPSGGIAGAVLIVRDESDRRQAEEQLRNMNRRKDDFLATLAHELRNPLAPIRTGLQLLKLSEGDQKIASEVQEIMERQILHMVRLVDDLLDVSRITRGKLQLRRCPVNFARVIATAVETMRSLIDDARHQLVVCVPEELDPIEADPDRLTQIACNLLHNAIKFTPSGGRIEVQVEQYQGELRLVVADNGRGIHPEKLETIFEMFNQGAEDKERGHSGLGIGLTLARRLAELHGGTIDAHSAGDNLGSTFRLRLPVGPRFQVPESPGQTGSRSVISNRRRRVLLVDDNEDGLRTIELMVQSLGNETCIARDGLEALESAQTFRPEVILMDLGMPRLSGYDAAQRLRQEPWGQDVLLIALTGWGQEKDRQRTLAAGFDDHFVKPVELEALRTCLERNRSDFIRARRTESSSTVSLPGK